MPIARSVGTSRAGADDKEVVAPADGKKVFRHFTFGDEVKWTDELRLHEVIAKDWVDREFVAERVTNFGELAKTVKQYPPERAAQICGHFVDIFDMPHRRNQHMPGILSPPMA